MDTSDPVSVRPTAEPGLWRDLREVLGTLTQALARPERRTARLYDMIGTRNLVNERSLYMNLGYWAGAPATYDAACEAMATLVSETAGMDVSDRVLDVGCGYGDAAQHWMARHQPARIVCLNLSADQLSIARERLPAEHRESGRVVMQRGSATQLPFLDRSFSLVIALESAQHFLLRDDFLREAHRVLVPGGRLVTAEILPKPTRSRWRGPVSLAEDFARTTFTAVPRGNWYTSDVYVERLRAAGFGDVEQHPIGDDVYAPLLRFMWARMDDPAVRRRINRFFRPRWMRHLVMSSDHIPRTHDYVIFRATNGS